MKVSIYYLSSRVGVPLVEKFRDCPEVELINDDITKCTADAVVSPANSFGFMDGGLDQALTDRFGLDLEQLVQNAIKALPEQELLIGQSLMLQTGDRAIPHLIVAPTMRVPMSFSISSSVNAYLAMKAVLVSAQKNSLGHIAVPSLCTGVGRMDPGISAHQMHTAYMEVILGVKKWINNFEDTQKHQLELNPKAMIWDY